MVKFYFTHTSFIQKYTKPVEMSKVNTYNLPMEKEFVIYVMEPEDGWDLNSPSSTMNTRTLMSKNGRIEINELDTIDRRLSIIKNSLSKDIIIDWVEKVRLAQYNGYEEVYYELKITPKDFVNYTPQTVSDTIEKHLKYVAIKYEMEDVWGSQSFTSTFIHENDLPYTFYVPLFVRKETPKSDLERMELQSSTNNTIFEKTMEYVMESLRIK